MIDGFWIAIATYSRLPAKQVDWKPESLRYSLCFFPLVGVFVGAAELIWLILSARLRLGAFLTGAVGCAIPILVTGGIHMDGFMDVLDALSSHRSREEMLRILKDSRVGAFAAMGAALYLLADAAALSEIGSRVTALAEAGATGAAALSGWVGAIRPALQLAAVFAVSRALSAYMVSKLPAARADGMAAAVKDAADERAGRTVRRVSALWAAVFAVLMLWAAPVPAALALCWAAAALLLYLRVTGRFGGVTGDLAGWFLQVCELGMALMIVLGGKL